MKKLEILCIHLLGDSQNGIILDYTVNVSEIQTGHVLQLSSGGAPDITIPGAVLVVVSVILGDLLAEKEFFD